MKLEWNKSKVSPNVEVGYYSEGTFTAPHAVAKLAATLFALYSGPEHSWRT